MSVKEWAYKAIATLLALFAPIHGMMGTALLLVLADLITGVWAAKKRGDAVSSDKLKRSVAKLLVYQTAIALAFLTEKYMLGGTIPLTNMAAGLIGTTELLSVLENLNSISGTDLLRAAIDKFKIEKK